MQPLRTDTNKLGLDPLAYCAGAMLFVLALLVLLLVPRPAAAAGSVALPFEKVTLADVPPKAVTISAVRSRKTHGSAGTFDLNLALTPQNPSTEPRYGGPSGNHLLVFVFSSSVTSGTATVLEGVATVGTPTFSGNEMRVPLSSVANAQYVTVSVNKVNGTDSAVVRVGFLAADVNASRTVTLSDSLLINGALSQAVTVNNYLLDVNVSGTLSLGDMLIVNAFATFSLPPPPLPPPSVSITSPPSGAVYTSPQTVMIAASASAIGGITKVEFYDGATLKSTATTAPFTHSWTFTSTNNGTHIWTAKAYDAYATSVSAPVSMYVSIGGLDTAPPVGSIAINGGALYTSSTTVTLALGATDGTAVVGHWLSMVSSPPSGTQVGWTSITPTTSYSASVPFTFTFTADGNKTVYAWYKDASSNVSAAASAQIVLDRTPPNNGTLNATAGLGMATLNWSGFSDNTSGLAAINTYALVYSTTGSPANCTSGSTLYTGTGNTFTHNSLTAGTTYYYRVCAVDKASNVSTGATASAVPVANVLPIAKAGPPQFGTAGVPVYFDGSGSYDPDGLISNYRFAFGDGLSLGSANGGVVQHSYSQPGTYTMTLTVTDNLGATHSSTAAVTINAAVPSQGNFRMARGFGGTYSDAGNAIAVDNAGNVVIVGAFQGSANFGGPAPLASTGGSTDVFIAKYSSSGAFICARQIGNTIDDRGYAVKMDANANIFVSGSFQGTVDFGGIVLTSSANSSDAFIAKYSPNCGPVVWAKNLGSSTDDIGYGLAIDPAGDVIVTGYFSGSADFGAGPVLSNGPFADVFVVKYAGSNGAYRWAHTLYGPSIDIGRSAAVDRDGNIIIVGSFQSTVAEGSTFQPLMTSAGSVDFFVMKFSPAGVYLWWRPFGGTGDDVAYGVDVDAGGNVAVVGSFQNTLFLGGGLLQSAGLSDSFIVKFSPMGNHLWSTRIGGAAIDVDYAVAVDPLGSVVMTGGYQFTDGQWNVIVNKYSSAGVPLWSRNYGSTASDVGLAVALDGGGNAYITGYYQGTVNFGGGNLTSAGLTDIFLLSLTP